MFSKKLAYVVLSGILACSILAGCGGGKSGEPPKPKVPVYEQIMNDTNLKFKKVFDLKGNKKAVVVKLDSTDLVLSNNYDEKINGTSNRNKIYVNNGPIGTFTYEIDKNYKLINKGVLKTSSLQKNQISQDGSYLYFVNDVPNKLYQAEVRAISTNSVSNNVKIELASPARMTLKMDGGMFVASEGRTGLVINPDMPIDVYKLSNGKLDQQPKKNVFPPVGWQSAAYMAKLNYVEMDSDTVYFAGMRQTPSMGREAVVAAFNTNGKEKYTLAGRHDVSEFKEPSHVISTKSYLVIQEANGYKMHFFDKRNGTYIATINMNDKNLRKELGMEGRAFNGVIGIDPKWSDKLILLNNIRNKAPEAYLVQIENVVKAAQ